MLGAFPSFDLSLDSYASCNDMPKSGLHTGTMRGFDYRKCVCTSAKSHLDLTYLRHSSQRSTERTIAKHADEDCVAVLTLFAGRTAVACCKSWLLRAYLITVTILTLVVKHKHFSSSSEVCERALCMDIHLENNLARTILSLSIRGQGNEFKKR